MSYIRSSRKYFCTTLLLGTLFITGFMIFWSQRHATKCSAQCQSRLFIDSLGHVNVRPAYLPFRLSASELSIAINNSATFSTHQINGEAFNCKYNAAQIAFLTQEKPQEKLYGRWSMTGNLLLQMRHDALIGLPGGGIRSTETLMQGLLRELKEEIGVQDFDGIQYYISYYNPRNHYCGHLFLKEVTHNELRKLAKSAMEIKDLGLENMGYMLLPTYNEIEEPPGIHGFPTFLAQAISPTSPSTLVGNTLQQILDVLTQATSPPILSREHIRIGIEKACQLLTQLQDASSEDKNAMSTTLSNFFD